MYNFTSGPIAYDVCFQLTNIIAGTTAGVGYGEPGRELQGVAGPPAEAVGPDMQFSGARQRELGARARTKKGIDDGESPWSVARVCAVRTRGQWRDGVGKCRPFRLLP